MSDEELIAGGAAVDWVAPATLRALGPPGCTSKVWVNKEKLLAGMERRDRGAEMEAEFKSLAEKAMAGLVAAGLDPVPDAPSEIAVTESLASWQQWAGYYSAYFERDVIPPPPHSAQLDAERARARDAEYLATEFKHQATAWTETARHYAAERDAERARAELAEDDAKVLCAEAEAAEHEAEVWKRRAEGAGAQIVRLMAERDEARNLLNMATDRLTKLQADVPKPAPSHNPFREFGGDRRRVGG